jgi:hypothetical protein
MSREISVTLRHLVRRARGRRHDNLAQNRVRGADRKLGGEIMTIARAALVAACLTATLSLGGCGTFYVDDQLKDIAPADQAKVTDPQPVQMLFQFQTKGVLNSRATDMLKKDVEGVVKGSGLFTATSETPAPSGAVINLTINNVPLTDDAYAKGFVTGFTFGLVGNTVGDGYICTVDYLPPGGGAKITKQARDAVYTSLGATASTPPHARKMKGIEEAVKAMAHKCLANPLNDVGREIGKAKP